MKIKHLLLTRFFPFQVSGFTRDVKSPDFLRSQAKIFKSNLLSSIENQTDKNFTLVIIVNKDSYQNLEIKEIVDGLKSSSPVDTKILPCLDIGGDINGFIRDEECQKYLSSYLNNYDYLIESRTDFDDFFHLNASRLVKDIVEQQPSGITFHGYCRGITYVSNEEMYLFDYFTDGQKRSGHWAIFTSMIMKCSDLKDKPFISPFNLNHGDPKPGLEKYGLTNGVDTKVIQDEMEDAFIYFKHDACWSSNGTDKIKLPDYARVRKFTEDECKNYVENIFPARFGFNAKNDFDKNLMNDTVLSNNFG